MDNLIKRLIELSSAKFHFKNTKLAKSLLLENGYPIKLIDERIKKFHSLKRKQQPSSNNNANNATQTINLTQNITKTTTRYKSLIFSSSCSQNIGKVLCKGIDDLKLGYQPAIKNRSNFTKLKQKSPKEEMYDVVYNIPCLSDGSGSKCPIKYEGQTGRKLKVRKGEHVDDLEVFEENGELENTTALVHHYAEFGHVPDIDKISILDVEHNYAKRKVLESLHILTNPSMNFRKDTENISAVYRSLIDAVKAPSI